MDEDKYVSYLFFLNIQNIWKTMFSWWKIIDFQEHEFQKKKIFDPDFEFS